MIKLTKKEDEVLSSFNGIEDAAIKTDLINWLFAGDGLLSENFNTDELKLKATQAILDGEWEVEEPMTLDEFKEEYKLLKSEYNRLRVVGNLSATRIHQEAVTKLVEEFLEEVE
ncbi:hypothetical protein Javan271_0023 [Streptococcus phage Javan271]|uniref:hypothetical protein n=1 Tax=Streptococcus iniae TaxID=1346 RepID=UPI000334811C|nr:hypothetical protein [Streptococcus iniae]AGM98666.1 hypothetical protein K710_0892 [Streptococcus iniae SF1]QBX16703.1 hypothetical protein Javan271_0023 [Streptococcus phage Javan271]WLR88565.1 hypothetical protein Q9317_04490 [Streptococcus iniae]